MSRDRLFLLTPGFADAKHPGKRFVCPDCLPVDGLLAAAPELAVRLDIVYQPFVRPRPDVIAALDADHQGVPVLVLGDEHPLPDDALAVGETRFVSNTRRILDLLAERHGFPQVH